MGEKDDQSIQDAMQHRYKGDIEPRRPYTCFKRDVEISSTAATKGTSSVDPTKASLVSRANHIAYAVRDDRMALSLHGK